MCIRDRFLYRAIESPWEFVLPGDEVTLKSGNDKKSSDNFTTTSSSRSNVQQASRLKERTSEDSDTKKKRALELQYITDRKRQLRQFRLTVETTVLNRLEGEVRGALQNIKGDISPDSFESAVSHGVDEKLAKLFAYPSYSEWVGSNSK